MCWHCLVSPQVKTENHPLGADTLNSRLKNLKYARTTCTVLPFPVPAPSSSLLFCLPAAGPSQYSQLSRKSPFTLSSQFLSNSPHFDPVSSDSFSYNTGDYVERSFVVEVTLEIVIELRWPFPLGDDQNIVEEKQVVALVAESPPDAVLFGGDCQLAALLQPPWRWDQRKRLQRHSRGFTCTGLQLSPAICLGLTLILPNSICFWMVYICSVLSIRLAPLLQLLTNCWTNNHNSRVTILLSRDCKVLFPPGEPLSTSLPCSWRAAPTPQQSTRLFCPLFSGIWSAERTRTGNVFSKSDFPEQLRSSCCDAGAEEKVNGRPAAAAAWWLSAWGGWGRRSWAGLHTHCCLRFASGSLWRRCCWSWEKNRLTSPVWFPPEDFGKNTGILTAASAASSAGRSHWSNRRCRVQNDWKRGFERCR